MSRPPRFPSLTIRANCAARCGFQPSETRFDAQAQKTELKALKSEAQTLAGSLPASEA
jgi:hypothetical protein